MWVVTFDAGDTPLIPAFSIPETNGFPMGTVCPVDKSTVVTLAAQQLAFAQWNISA